MCIVFEFEIWQHCPGGANDSGWSGWPATVATQVGVMGSFAAGTTVLRRLPPVEACWAYGSAVKKQTGRSAKETPMLDLLVTVSDASSWHADNLQSNAHHYSGLASLGANTLAKYQRSLPARVYYNTLVPLPDEGIYFKYGVVTADDLIKDLDCWDYLYLAGRLHKPVQTILEPPPRLQHHINQNLISAVRAALLLLPERFTPYHLFYTISNMSYSGDFRMIFGENKNKVKNIVTPQLDQFQLLYQYPITSFKQYLCKVDQDYVQDLSPESVYSHLSQLPSHLKNTVCKLTGRNAPQQEILRSISPADSNRLVQKALCQIVWNSSVTQSIKGILTAGFVKSFKYSFNKIKKMF